MGETHELPPEPPLGQGSKHAADRRQLVRSGILLAVTGVSLYLLLPGLLSVFSSWRSLEHLDWPFAVLVLLLEVASSVCLWEVDRIALASDAWFPIASAQLAGNALGRIVPGSATPFTVVMLQRAGVDAGEAAAALTASTGLQITTALALPVLAVPAMIGGAPVDRGLANAAYLGAAVVVLLIGAGAVLFETNGPLEWIGRMIQRLLNMTVRRRTPVTGLSDQLLSDRNFIRTTLDRRWKAAILAAAGNTGFDYLALLCALRAVGASPQPSLVILAYASAELLAQIPFTPGGARLRRSGSGRDPLVGRRPCASRSRRDASLSTRVVLVADPGRWGRVSPLPSPLPVTSSDQLRSRGRLRRGTSRATIDPRARWTQAKRWEGSVGDAR